MATVFIEVIKSKGEITGRTIEDFWITYKNTTKQIRYGKDWNFEVDGRVYQFQSGKSTKAADVYLKNPEGKLIKIKKRGCYINLETFEEVENVV